VAWNPREQLPYVSYKQQDRQCTYNNEARSCNHCCSETAMSITCSECVSVAVVIQHAIRISRVILLSVTFLAVPHFFTVSHKRNDFGEKSYRT
jgi:hypothetical protein